MFCRHRQYFVFSVLVVISLVVSISCTTTPAAAAAAAVVETPMAGDRDQPFRRRRRRQIRPNGKRQVLMHAAIDNENGKSLSNMELHRHLFHLGFEVVSEEKSSMSGNGVVVYLTEDRIQSLAEHDDTYVHDRDFEGTMMLDDKVSARFLDGEETNQEAYIRMAPDPSYLCRDDVSACANKSMTEFYASYQYPDAIYLRLDNLMIEYPDFVRKDTMGRTYFGRNQTLYKLTNFNNPNWENNKVIFWYCGTHPREAIPTMTCSYIMETLLLKERNGTSSDFITKDNNGLLNEVTFIILPIFNVDTFYYNHEFNELISTFMSALDTGTLDSAENKRLWEKYEKSKLHRMTMKPNTARCISATSWSDILFDVTDVGNTPYNQTQCIETYFGVDLNRNFPSHWMGGGAGSVLDQQLYAGLYPADQIETQNMMEFVNSISDNLLSSVDVHCCAGLWLVPNGWMTCKKSEGEGVGTCLSCDEAWGESFDQFLMDEWAKVATDAISQVNGNEYKYGAITTTIYPAGGSGIDWMYEKFGSIYVGATEITADTVSPHSNYPLYAFAARSDLILPGAKDVYGGMVASVQFLIDDSADRVSDIDEFPLPLPGYPIEYLCGNAKQQTICDLDCTDIQLFPFELEECGLFQPYVPDETAILIDSPFVEDELTPVTAGTGVDPCGMYLESFENGKATYVSVGPGIMIRDLCPRECNDADPIFVINMKNDVEGTQDTSSVEWIASTWFSSVIVTLMRMMTFEILVELY